MATEQSSPSGVDVNYFDPEGTNELRQTISRMSARTHDVETGSANSEETLDGAFDFRKLLEQVSQQYVPL